MARFIDAYLPTRILGFSFVTSPEFSTTLTKVASGDENANQNWEDPIRRFSSPKGVRCWEDVLALYTMWMVTKGRSRTFAMRDPFDFASVDIAAPNQVPEVSWSDQELGVGDGLTREFQLVKTYEFGGETYSRMILHPIVDTVVVSLNDLDPASSLPGTGDPYTWTVDRNTGVVTFTPAPANGLIVRAGFLFDVEARWESDNAFQGIVEAFRVAGFADLSFIEVRPC